MSYLMHESYDGITDKSSRHGSQPIGAPKRRHSESDLEVLPHREKKGSSVQHAPKAPWLAEYPPLE